MSRVGDTLGLSAPSSRIPKVRVRRKQWYPWALVLPAFIILTVLVIFPLIYSAFMSTQFYNLAKPQYGQYFVGLGNYVEAFGDSSFLESLRLALLLSVFVVAIEFLAGLGLALLVNRDLKGMTVIQTLFLIPFVLTPVVVGLLWRYMFQTDIGILNYFLGVARLPLSGWHTDSSTALLSIALIDIWQWTPFMMLIFLAGLQSLPAEPFEAAKMEGAGSWSILRFLTLPMMKQLILVAILLRLIYSFKIFDTIMVLTKGGPGFSTQVYNIHLYKTIFRFFNVGYGSAMSFIMLAVTLVLSWVLVRTLYQVET